MLRLAVVTLMLVACAFAMGGCSLRPAAPKAPTRFSNALELVPETVASRSAVTIVDLKRLREAPVTAPATTGTPFARVVARLAGLGIATNQTLWGLPVAAATAVAATPDEAGIRFDEVDLVVDVPGEDGKYDSVFIATGRFDVKKLTRTLAACRSCHATPTGVPYRGAQIFRWAPQLQIDFNDETFVSVTKGAVFHTRTIERMTDALDLAAGHGRSLAGGWGYKEVALNLEVSRAIVATISPDSPARLSAGEGATPLRPYFVDGVGQSVDEHGFVITLVIAHATELDSKANAKTLEERLIRGRSERLGKAWLEVFVDTRINEGGKLVFVSLRVLPGFTEAQRLSLPDEALALLVLR